VVRVQKIRVPDTGRLSWIVIDAEHVPVRVVNEYLVYLHRLGRSPNTVRAYAHHLQAYWAFLIERKHDWRDLKLTQLAEFVSWVRHATRAGGAYRSDATINLILAAVASFYEYQDRLGVETSISRSRRFGAKSPYKPFLHHISRTQSLRHAVVRVKAIKRLPRACFHLPRFNLYSTPAHVCGIGSFCACCTRVGCGSGKLWVFVMPTSGLTMARSISCRAQTATALLQNLARRMWCMSRNKRWHCTQTTWFMSMERSRMTMFS
jgi:hypothetical protein